MFCKKTIKYIYNLLFKKCLADELVRNSAKKTFSVNDFKNYDVISFDIFDTLLLRDVVSSKDVFILTGLKLGFNGFSEIRKQAEKYAEYKKFKNTNIDVSIYEIYDVIEQWTGIPQKKGLLTELEIEKSVCHVNNTFKTIFSDLFRMQKKIVFTSDMYFSSMQIKELLEFVGFENIPEIYVSCEHKASKRNGDLFKIIMQKYGKSLRYVHIGNDKKSDVVNAKKSGWKTLYYACPSFLGRKYKTISNTIVQDSLNSGIINRFLYTPNMLQSEEEKFGFVIFGNLFVSYCKWISTIAKSKGIKKIFFLARDGYLLKELFDKYIKSFETEYLIVSRFALCQISSEWNIESFIHENIENKLHSNLTIEQVFKEINLENIFNIIQSKDFLQTEILSNKNFEIVAAFIRENRTFVAECYSNASKAAALYFSEVFRNCKNALFVDVGWYSTCFLNIKNFLKGNLSWNGDLFCTLLGIQCNKTNIELVNSGVLFPFLFSPDYNKTLFQNHNTQIGNILTEIAFSAPMPSLKNYVLNGDGTFSFNYQTESNVNIDIVKRLQNGILKYAEEYFNFESRSGLNLTLSGENSYLTFNSILHKKKYIRKLFGNYFVTQATSGSMERAKPISEYIGR